EVNRALCELEARLAPDALKTALEALRWHKRRRIEIVELRPPHPLEGGSFDGFFSRALRESYVRAGEAAACAGLAGSVAPAPAGLYFTGMRIDVTSIGGPLPQARCALAKRVVLDALGRFAERIIQVRFYVPAPEDRGATRTCSLFVLLDDGSVIERRAVRTNVA